MFDCHNQSHIKPLIPNPLRLSYDTAEDAVVGASDSIRAWAQLLGFVHSTNSPIPSFSCTGPFSVGVLLIQGFWKDTIWWITETLSVSLTLWFPFRFSHCHETDLSKSLSLVCLHSMFLFTCVCVSTLGVLGSRSRFHSEQKNFKTPQDVFLWHQTPFGFITKSYFAFPSTEGKSQFFCLFV